MRFSDTFLLLNAVGGTNTVRYESEYTHLLALRSSSSLLFSFSPPLSDLLCFLSSPSFAFLSVPSIILYYISLSLNKSRLVSSETRLKNPPLNLRMNTFSCVILYCTPIVLSSPVFHSGTRVFSIDQLYDNRNRTASSPLLSSD